MKLNNQFVIKKDSKLTIVVEKIKMPPNLRPFEGIMMYTGDP